MSHGVGNDVDSEWVRALERVFLKVFDCLSLLLPCIGHVVVVAEESYQSMVVVEVAPKMG